MASKQFSTFFVSGSLCGLEVTAVQEVTRPLEMTRVPLAPNYVHGLINLRGQIATAIGLRELFHFELSKNNNELMNIICKADNILLSLLVDQISDVIEVDDSQFESTPDSLPEGVKKFMVGVYKIPGMLLSVLDIEKIIEELHK